MKTKKTAKATVKRHTVSHKKVASVVPFNSSKLVPLILVTSLLFLFFALLAWVVGIKSKWLSTQEAVSADVNLLEPKFTFGQPITGTVYMDLNGNGKKDSSDFGLSGIGLGVSYAGGNLNYKTNSSGVYSFIPSKNGTVSIDLVMPVGYTPFNNVEAYRRDYKGKVQTVDFPLRPAIWGIVFEDGNGDGQLGYASTPAVPEKLMSGVSVVLKENGVVKSIYVSDSGFHDVAYPMSGNRGLNYYFYPGKQGNYEVVLGVPSGYTPTTAVATKVNFTGAPVSVYLGLKKK